MVRLGIPQGFAIHDVQGMWNHLQNPYIRPQWTYITDVDQIESLLIQWQYLHYTQANNTPLSRPSWTSQHDPTNLTPSEINTIISETLDSDDTLSPTTKALLQQIKSNRLPMMPKPMYHITTDKF